MPTASGSVEIKVELTQSLPTSSTRAVAASQPFRVAAGAVNTYTSGTAASQIEKTAYQSLSLAGSAQTIDMSTITCSDGSSGFSKLRGLLIISAATNVAHTITFGNAASSPLAPWYSASTVTETIDGGGRLLKERPIGSTGWTVDSSNKNLKFDPGANTFTAYVYAWGN